jgi:hypothetical protein
MPPIPTPSRTVPSVSSRLRAAAPWRASLAIAGTALAAALLVACGGSSGKPPSSKDAADNALAFSRCMREHGVKDFPNPEVSGGLVRLKFTAKAGAPGGVTPQTMEAAQNACKHFQPAQQTHLSPQEKVAREEEVMKFASCMRAHGVNVHASTSGGGVQIRIQGNAGSGGPNPESPSFQAAQNACQGLLPSKGSGGVRGGPSTGTAGAGKGAPGAGLSLGG